MQQILSNNWFRKTAGFTVAAVLLTFVPFAPVAVAGGLILITILPGLQLTRWLGLYKKWPEFGTIILSVTLGLVSSPVLIYWSSLLFGFNRPALLVIFTLYIIIMGGVVSRDTISNDKEVELEDSSPTLWIVAGLLIGLTALGVFLSYFELETARGFYPVQMEDWQKHYGVAFALRYTGMPPTSMFFYGMFPDEKLVYYFFLHLNGATLDLLQSGKPFLHNSFSLTIVLASLAFSSIFFLLAQTLFRSQKVAVWSLAFATVIGGLDVIPIIQRTIQKYRENFPDSSIPFGLFLPREHIDNWVSALSLRLNTFYAHHVWVPQHLTALTIICLGSYLYLKVENRRKLLLIFPLLLFALLGHSVWIALITSVCLFIFALMQIFSEYRRQGFPAARTVFFAYAIIAVSFIIIAAPFILPLMGTQAPKSGIVFAIPKLDSWPLLHPFQAAFGTAIWARLLDLPLHFFIEMGALLIAGLGGLLLFWRRRAVLYTPLFPFYLTLLAIGFITVSFFASGRGWVELGLVQNNDLGLRALMPGQMILALFGGYFMAQLPALNIRRGWKILQTIILSLLIGLGVASSSWEFTAMGLSKYWYEPQLTPDMYQLLRAMPELTTPQDKLFPVVQHRIHRDASRFQLSLAGRPVSFSTGEAIVFHRELKDLAIAHELSKQAFNNRLPVWSYQMFRNLGADYIFVGPAEREAIRHPQKYKHPQYFKPIYKQGDFELYQVLPPSYDNNSPQAIFDGGAIEFQGFFIDQNPLYPGDKNPSLSDKARGLVTAWRLTRTADKNYTAFIHLVDAEGNIIAQADHQLWAWNVKTEGPTTIWTPKLTNFDIYPIPEDALTAEGTITIRLGLWLPDTGQQFPVESTQLKVDEGGRLILGELSP